MPYSRHDWHWRLRVANEFGHAAAAETVHGTLALLDDQGIAGELALREARTGRVEVTQMWGRPESVRQEFRKRRVAVARGARALLSPDLLFGSKVEGALRAAGHEVVRGAGGEVAVIDLTLGRRPGAGRPACPTLGFYLHTEQDVAPAGRGRRLRPGGAALAHEPRGAQLVERLLAA